MIMTNNVFIKSKPYEYRAHPFCLMILYQIIFFKITFCHANCSGPLRLCL